MNNNGKVKVIKFFSNLEILAEILEQRNDFVRVKNPIIAQVMIPNDKTKNPTIGFLPFSVLSDAKEVRLETSAILCIMDPTLDAETNYKQIFSPILQPTGPNLIVK
jgi:hypothetical protein